MILFGILAGWLLKIAQGDPRNKLVVLLRMYLPSPKATDRRDRTWIEGFSQDLWRPLCAAPPVNAFILDLLVFNR
jgi:hypothetical protein